MLMREECHIYLTVCGMQRVGIFQPVGPGGRLCGNDNYSGSVDCILLGRTIEDKPMTDGDIDIVCIMLFLAVTVVSIFYCYTPIC